MSENDAYWNIYSPWTTGVMPKLAPGEFGKTSLTPSEEECRVLGQMITGAWLGSGIGGGYCQHANPLCPCASNTQCLSLFLEFFGVPEFNSYRGWFSMEALLRGKTIQVSHQVYFNKAISTLYERHSRQLFPDDEVPLSEERVASKKAAKLKVLNLRLNEPLQLVYEESSEPCGYSSHHRDVGKRIRLGDISFCSEVCLLMSLGLVDEAINIKHDENGKTPELPADYLNQFRLSWP